MTKIVALVEFCPPRLGSDRRIYEMLTRLPEHYEVHFIVFPPSRALLGMIPLPAEHLKETHVTLKENIKAHYISLPTFLRAPWRNYLLGYLLTLLYVSRKVVQEIRRINPQVITLNYPSAYTGLVGFSIGKLLNRRVVADFNDMIAEYTMSFLDYGTESSGKMANRISKDITRKILTTIQDYIISNADAVIAVTNQIVDYCKLHGIRKDVYLIPDGVDVKIFDPERYFGDVTNKIRNEYDIKEHEKIVVYIGRLEKWAGVQIVLRCAEKLKGSNIKFLLIGEGTLKPSPQMPSVIFCGRIPHEQVPMYLAAADLVLVPMEHDVVGNSAGPLKLFEAMAMKKAIIASNTRGISEVITNNVEGVLVPQDENLWAEAIKQLLKNSSRASELGENASRRIRAEFDWSVLVNRLAAILLPAEGAKRPC
ncbi:MAG: glycosyltransferase family 4 protein [Candidatus Bathyarchaeia archaeon]|jgi:glycosyltransferase involved in cell wall biosynthesis